MYKSLYSSSSCSSPLSILSRCYFLIAIPNVARKLRASALPSFVYSAAYRLVLCRSRSSRQLLYRLQRSSRCSSVSSLLQSHLLLVPLLNRNKQLFRQLQPSLITQYALYIALELADVISSPFFYSQSNCRKQLLGPCRFLVCAFKQALDQASYSQSLRSFLSLAMSLSRNQSCLASSAQSCVFASRIVSRSRIISRLYACLASRAAVLAATSAAIGQFIASLFARIAYQTQCFSRRSSTGSRAASSLEGSFSAV